MGWSDGNEQDSVVIEPHCCDAPYKAKSGSFLMLPIKQLKFICRTITSLVKARVSTSK